MSAMVGGDGHGRDEAQELADQARVADQQLDHRARDDRALHVRDAHLEAGVAQAGHAADGEGGRQEAEGAALHDGEAVAERGLQEGGDPADEEHRGDELGERHGVAGDPERLREQQRDGHGGAEHREVVLEAEDDRLPERRLVVDAVDELVR
ncbi:MAG: hypothetical protein M5U28_33580 [Sandaracinaceae bacterium]|nr:hypothetical protein [Sandaracinaceae bacterium]